MTHSPPARGGSHMGFGLGGVGTEGSAGPGAFLLGTGVLDFLGPVPVSNN